MTQEVEKQIVDSGVPPEEEFLPFFMDIGWEAIAPLLEQYFEHRVVALMKDIELTRGHVALRYFKNEVLPQNLAYNMGRLCSELLINQMIRNGKLEVDKRHFEGRDFPVSVLRLVR